MDGVRSSETAAWPVRTMCPTARRTTSRTRCARGPGEQGRRLASTRRSAYLPTGIRMRCLVEEGGARRGAEEGIVRVVDRLLHQANPLGRGTAVPAFGRVPVQTATLVDLERRLHL